MSPLELARAGKRLYGEFWRKPLATTLGINVSTLRRWENGEIPIKPVAALAIQQLLRPTRKKKRRRA